MNERSEPGGESTHETWQLFLKGLSRRLREVAANDPYKAISDKTHINSETVRRYMLGLSPPSVEFLDHFSAAYGVTMTWLVRGQGPKFVPDVEKQAIQQASLETLFHAIAMKLKTIETLSVADQAKVTLSGSELGQSANSTVAHAPLASTYAPPVVMPPGVPQPLSEIKPDSSAKPQPKSKLNQGEKMDAAK